MYSFHGSDVVYLLAELRKAHEALERVEAVAEEWEATSHVVALAFAHELRAAVAAAKGDEA